jgi:hypothetical protein
MQFQQERKLLQPGNSQQVVSSKAKVERFSGGVVQPTEAARKVIQPQLRLYSPHLVVARAVQPMGNSSIIRTARDKGHKAKWAAGRDSKRAENFVR